MNHFRDKPDFGYFLQGIHTHVDPLLARSNDRRYRRAHLVDMHDKRRKQAIYTEKVVSPRDKAAHKVVRYSHEGRREFDLIVCKKIFHDRSDHPGSLECDCPRWISHIYIIVVVGFGCGRWHVRPM